MDAARLVDLVEALSHAHNEVTCTRAACEVLALRSLEIVLERSGEPVRRYRAGTAQDGASSEAPVKVPLEDVGGASGYAAMVFRAEAPPPAMLAMMGRVLAASLRQAHAFARVARVSHGALARSKALDEHLAELVLPSSIVAVAPSTRRIFTEIIPLVARRDTNVLVLGETGTGKELVAHRIHELSPRARRPFVRINCGAMPAGLVESLLFGHERGAFTDASRRHIGVFERAHGGTLFLDEIAELPLAAQVKLLRALETGEVERVGGDRTMHLDVRLVAATHQHLEARVREGAFREDLFYRLAVFPIHCPPLRERPTEIAALARHILGELAQRFGQTIPQLDRASLDRLRGYAWPGNVRELMNVLERSLLLCRDGRLVIDLPAARARGAATSFDEVARRAIEDALHATQGRVYGPEGAAALLRLKPTTLMSKMKRFGVRR